MKTFICSICKQEKEVQTKGGTGYATNEKGEKICYQCCAEEDRKYMRENGKISLYLSENENGGYKISNWHSTLIFTVTGYRKGRHNIAGKRLDVWFRFEGYCWHGVNYGEMTQILHCKKTKTRS